MPRPKTVIDATVAEKAEAALKALPDSKVCIRLKAISCCAHYPINLVSSIFGTDRITLWRWIKRFATKGLAGLAAKPKGHKPPKLGAEQRQQVARWLKEGRTSQGEPISWTLQKLRLAIKTEFDISLGQTTTWTLVRQLGFRQKAPRPRHDRVDKQPPESVEKTP